jgi:hypothetical protein
MKKAFEEQEEGDVALFDRRDGMLFILGVPSHHPSGRSVATIVGCDEWLDLGQHHSSAHTYPASMAWRDFLGSRIGARPERWFLLA